MLENFSDDDAALVAHKIVLAVLVSEAEMRLGDDASDFLGQIRQAAVASIERAEAASIDMDLLDAKQRIIRAIDDIFTEN